MTANAVGINTITCFPKQGGARDNKFLITHPMTSRNVSKYFYLFIFYDYTSDLPRLCTFAMLILSVSSQYCVCYKFINFPLESLLY
jgi:hypothetical protein